jgi:hypothetical protein
VELARKLPFLAVFMALLTLSVGSLMISQGVVGAQTDPGVGTDAPVDDDEDEGDSSNSGGALPSGPAVDTNPLNAGNAGTGLPPAAPIDGPVAGPASGVGTTAAGLPQTGSGGYLDAGSANSSFYMLVSVVAMMGLAGSLVYARARSKQ